LLNLRSRYSLSFQPEEEEKSLAVNMPTLGEELRRRREERGTTLAEISEATRIGTRFLKAIEADNFSVLPGGIYTRNFIRSYAGSVGMGEDEAIALYHQQISGQPPDAAPPAPIEPHPLPASETKARIHRLETVAVRQSAPRTSWSTIVIAAGIVLIILIIGVSLVQRLNRGGANGDTQPTGNSSVEPPRTQTPPPQTTPQPQPEAGQVEPPAPKAAAISASDPIRVRLEAAEGPCSMVYWIDDETKSTNLFLPQGESRDLPPAQREVRLSIGNRTVLKLKINERQATFPADLQKFKARVVISRENLNTFFP
jgi:cytoskeletal protein RodZ